LHGFVGKPQAAFKYFIVKRKFQSILSFVLSLVIGQALCAQEGRDLQLWNTLSVQGRINQSYDFKISTKTQYLVNEQHRDVTYLDLAAYRKMNNWLKLGAAFRVSQLVKEHGDIVEYRPQLISAIYLKSKNIQYQTTNRIEHRSFSEGPSHFRYYHNIFVHFPSIAHLPKVYVGEELFTKFNAENLFLGRIYGGLHLLDRGHFGIDVYYVWQKLKVDKEWQGANVLGLNLNYRLRPKNGMPHSPGS
jgi:hypothetical protein